MQGLFGVCHLGSLLSTLLSGRLVRRRGVWRLEFGGLLCQRLFFRSMKAAVVVFPASSPSATSSTKSARALFVDLFFLKPCCLGW